MKTMKTILIGLIASATIVSCNKYEEGPAISLIPKKERVANTWVIYHAEDNGNDVSDDYDQYELYLTSDGDAELSADYTFLGTQYQTETNGTWNFTSDKENISFDYEDDSQDGEYQILMLTEEEMRLRKTGDDLELRFTEK